MGSGCNTNVKLAYVKQWQFKNNWDAVPEKDLKSFLVSVSGPPPQVVDPNQVTFSMSSDSAVEVIDDVYQVTFTNDKTLGLKLESNPTTGYKWMVKDADKMKCLEQLESSYRMDDKGYPKAGSMGLTGVGGIRTLKFKAAGEAGCTERVDLAYYQPWNFPGFDSKEVRPKKILVKVLPTETDILKYAFVKGEKSVDLEVKAGKFAAIDIAGNPSTGYQWHIKEQDNNDCVTMVHSSYKVNDAPKGYTGVPGVRTLLFKVGEEGCKEQLLLNYAQPWMFKEFDMENTDSYTKLNISVVKP